MTRRLALSGDSCSTQARRFLSIALARLMCSQSSGPGIRLSVELTLWICPVFDQEQAVELGVAIDKLLSQTVLDGGWRKMLLTQPPVEVLWVALPGARGKLPADTTLADLVVEGQRLGWG